MKYVFENAKEILTGMIASDKPAIVTRVAVRTNPSFISMSGISIASPMINLSFQYLF